jgi:hypothetical protein
MGRVLDKTKLVVKKASEAQKEWLYTNPEKFAVPYRTPKSEVRKEWPCFILMKGKDIIGYRSFEFYDQGGRTHAWVGSTSLRKGFEGQGLGPFLFGRANSMLHAKKFDEVRTWAHELRAKKFWAREGYARIGGAALDVPGNTNLRLDLKKQRESVAAKRMLRRGLR